MSAVVRERRLTAAAVQLERRIAEDRRERARVQRLARVYGASRQYAAAATDRLSSDWSVASTSYQTEIFRYLRSLRARSRDMARNNPHMRRFLGMVRRNVVGPAGIKLQVRAKRGGELDERLNTEVEAKFREWSLPETCSASGKYSWVDCQGMAINTMARDGEFLCRFIEADNPFGFSLKFYDVAYLDETFNEVLGNGNRVVMSVEVDRYDRPAAYYFTTPRYDVTPYARESMERVRVPAEEVVHSFLPFEDDGQIRGVPWAHAAMWNLRKLGQFEEAALINAHVAACSMGFLIPPDNDENAGIPEEGERAPIEAEYVAGVMRELPPGYEVKTIDAAHPNNDFDPFTSTVLRGAACGLDVSYFALAGDLEAVNYSSARVGLLDDRDNYRSLQNFVIDHFCRRVYRQFLKRGILTGALNILPSDFERLMSPDFQPRGWAWVDPLKDVAASVEAINNGLDTRSRVIAESGGDFEEVVRRLKEEQDFLMAQGVLTKSGDLAVLAAIAAASDDRRG
ncbi:MAG TPA: phage portal protein [Pyrinomonadaceae bacterium]|jgi:lambda family phage portal protein